MVVLTAHLPSPKQVFSENIAESSVACAFVLVYFVFVLFTWMVLLPWCQVKFRSYVVFHVAYP